jgi:hypothetical protein
MDRSCSGETMDANSERRPRRVFLAVGLVAGAVIVGLLACAWALVVQGRDAMITQAVSRLRPGMTYAEVQAALKPVLDDHTAAIWDKQGAAYMYLRVTDESIIVVMERKQGEERVAKVDYLPDKGPSWERWRRNWEARFRDWKWRFR